MKILAVSQYYTPDITAAAFRVAETVDHLKTAGNEVRVVTTFPHKSDISENITSGEHGIYRVTLPNTENQGFLGYIYLYLSFLYKSILKGIKVGRKLKPDVVWATSPPIFVGLAGWLLAKVLNTGFALDIRDIWPDSAVAAGQISGTGISYKFGRAIEKFLYKHADIITCVATPMKGYIENHTDTPVEVIYNGVEIPNEQKEYYPNDVLQEFAKMRDSKKILYAGNFGHVQQLDLLINMFLELKQENLEEDWEIFFLGGGAQKENLKQLTSENKLSERIHFLDPVPKEEVFSYLQSADALFIHLMDSEVLRLTIPSKVFDYMLADRPLLAGIHGEGRDIIESLPGNFTFESGNLQGLVKSFQNLDQFVSQNGSCDNASMVKEHFSRKKQSNKVDQIFKQTFI